MVRLFPLQLEGEGSDIESLPSYVLRLAHLHAVPVSRLLDSLPYQSSVKTANKLLAGSLGSLARPISTTKLVIDALAKVSSEDRATLRAATLLPVEAAIARSVSSFALHLRWCPCCLAEQIVDSDTPYLKLAWQLLGIEACIHHRVLLQDRCPACRSTQRGWYRNVPLNICDRCGARLDGVLHKSTPRASLEQCGPDLLEMVREAALIPAPEYPNGGSCHVVRTLIGSLKASGICPDRFAHLNLLEVSKCISGRRMSLPMARRVAFHLGISLPELFLGDVSGINHAFGFCLLNQLPASMAPLANEHLGGEQAMYRALVRILESAARPPSLREVAQRLKVSTGALRHRFPVEAKQIARAWRRSRAIAAKLQRGRLRNIVTKCIDRWGTQHGQPLTKKRVELYLQETTDFPKTPLLDEIDRVFAARKARHKITQQCVQQGIRSPWNHTPPSEL